MPLEVRSIFTSADETQLILKRAVADGDVQIIIVGPNSQQLSYSIDPAGFLEGIKALYPDLIVQLPT